MIRVLVFLILATITLRAADPIFQDALQAFQKEDYSTARMLFETVLATDPKNTAAQNYLRVIATREKGDGTGLQAMMRKIILPRVEFNDVSTAEAVAYISQQVEKQSGGKQKLGVVWLVLAGELPPVTLSLDNVPALDALRYVCEMAGVSAEYDATAVRIVKKPQPAP